MCLRETNLMATTMVHVRVDEKTKQRAAKTLAAMGISVSDAVRMLLLDGSRLPARCKDHPLGGDWKHFRDCHIEPDWLLFYKIDDDDLHLVRTGTHSDLF